MVCCTELRECAISAKSCQAAIKAQFLFQAQFAWTPEQYLEAWRREKRRERGTRGRRRGKSSFEETVVEGDEEEEELIHVVADGEQMRRKLCSQGEEEGGRRGEKERGSRKKEEKEEGERCTQGEEMVGEERRGRGRRVDSEVNRHSR